MLTLSGTSGACNIAEVNDSRIYAAVSQRYGGVTPEGLLAVLNPLLIPISSLDKTIVKLPEQTHWRASFEVHLQAEWDEVAVPGTTGKFIPKEVKDGGGWREIAKGRFLQVDETAGLVRGEIYGGGTKAALVEAVEDLSADDFLEVDQYGASAKLLSGLVEYSFAEAMRANGMKVRRMPQDVARHIGAYLDFDFVVTRAGEERRVEVKSLWGTNTVYARLIHSKGARYPTSSCRFDTQDIFAVSLFLRTGDVSDFAFARSVPIEAGRGLPTAAAYPEHVNQNPLCTIGDGTWFDNIAAVW